MPVSTVSAGITILLFVSFFLTITTTVVAEFAHPLTKLKRPVVIMISSDGFRFGYQYKTNTPNIRRLIDGGTEAETGLMPVFPTQTFPNHYAIVTGLYPAYHGIIANRFYDPKFNENFTTAKHDPKWWLGEPLWQTAVKNGLNAAAYFWPGSEVKKDPWTCPPQFCPKYNQSVTFEDRVDTVLGYFDRPSDEIPSFIALYFHYPDEQGHHYGPDDARVTEGIAKIDEMVGRLIAGLEKRQVFEDVNIILLGDHGMVGTCDQKLIFLDKLAPWIEIPERWVQQYAPILHIRPQPEADVDLSQVVEKMNEALKSIDKAKFLKVYLKDKLPERLHYSDSYRIPPIIGLVEEGFKVERRNTSSLECGGNHGFDNALFSMRTIFIGHGPRFEKGKKVMKPFENIQIYNMVTQILGIKGAPNNGTEGFVDSVFYLPKPGTILPGFSTEPPPIEFEEEDGFWFVFATLAAVARRGLAFGHFCPAYHHHVSSSCYYY